MTIEVTREQLGSLIAGIKKYKLRHGPFNKTGSGYRIYLYPNSRLTLLLLTESLEILK